MEENKRIMHIIQDSVKQIELRGIMMFLESQPITHVGKFTTRQALTGSWSESLVQAIYRKVSVEPSGKKTFKLFWVAERFGPGDGFHLSCLICCPSEGTILAMRQWYEKQYGWSKIERKRGPASGYDFVKRIFNPNTEYGIL